jgi:hypothetical protein
VETLALAAAAERAAGGRQRLAAAGRRHQFSKVIKTPPPADKDDAGRTMMKMEKCKILLPLLPFCSLGTRCAQCGGTQVGRSSS